MSTTDERVAIEMHGHVEGRIHRLQVERAELARAPERLAEIDAELVLLGVEKARLEPRLPRPPPPEEPPPREDPPVQPETPREPRSR